MTIYITNALELTEALPMRESCRLAITPVTTTEVSRKVHDEEVLLRLWGSDEAKRRIADDLEIDAELLPNDHPETPRLVRGDVVYLAQMGPTLVAWRRITVS